MVSPSELMSRVGPGGRWVVFFKAVCVYFVVGGAAPSAPAALQVATKCAPIICLLGLVLLQAPPHRRRYSRRVAVGLALSAVGDAFLVWPYPHTFVAGMAAFAAAHVAYLAAFAGEKPRVDGFRRALLAGVVAAPGVAWLSQLSPPGALRVLVPIYGALLSGMCWRALVTAPRPAAAGAVLFMISDAALGYHMFGAPLPHRRLIVMITYYLAQLGIAYSVLSPTTTENEPSSPEAKKLLAAQ